MDDDHDGWSNQVTQLFAHDYLDDLIETALKDRPVRGDVPRFVMGYINGVLSLPKQTGLLMNAIVAAGAREIDYKELSEVVQEELDRNPTDDQLYIMRKLMMIDWRDVVWKFRDLEYDDILANVNTMRPPSEQSDGVANEALAMLIDNMWWR